MWYDFRYVRDVLLYLSIFLESLENKILHYAKKGRIELPKSVEQ